MKKDQKRDNVVIIIGAILGVAVFACMFGALAIYLHRKEQRLALEKLLPVDYNTPDVEPDDNEELNVLTATMGDYQQVRTGEGQPGGNDDLVNLKNYEVREASGEEIINKNSNLFKSSLMDQKREPLKRTTSLGNLSDAGMDSRKVGSSLQRAKSASNLTTNSAEEKGIVASAAPETESFVQGGSSTSSEAQSLQSGDDPESESKDDIDASNGKEATKLSASVGSSDNMLQQKDNTKEKKEQSQIPEYNGVGNDKVDGIAEQVVYTSEEKTTTGGGESQPKLRQKKMKIEDIIKKLPASTGSADEQNAHQGIIVSYNEQQNFYIRNTSIANTKAMNFKVIDSANKNYAFSSIGALLGSQFFTKDTPNSSKQKKSSFFSNLFTSEKKKILDCATLDTMVKVYYHGASEQDITFTLEEAKNIMSNNIEKDCANKSPNVLREVNLQSQSNGQGLGT